MLTLIIGGAASGKSAYGEALACAQGGRRIYLATMEPFGAEGQRRIAKHRAMRRDKGFETVERFTDLAHLTLPPDCTVLLECVGNLTANELYAPSGAGDRAADAVVSGVQHLVESCRHVIAVSNEVGSGGQSYAGDTLRYLRYLGEINCRLSAMAESVYEVICGIPIRHKGADI